MDRLVKICDTWMDQLIQRFTERSQPANKTTVPKVVKHNALGHIFQRSDPSTTAAPPHAQWFRNYSQGSEMFSGIAGSEMLIQSRWVVAQLASGRAARVGRGGAGGRLHRLGPTTGGGWGAKCAQATGEEETEMGV
ncbi:hypothetical protein ZWY2020_059566 [Hordeum vulgare]|nr:hypothetical protein ZWY2020_059566 [Hordeum vulgare]